MTASFIRSCLVLPLAALTLAGHASAQTPTAKTRIVPFATSPFPYRGMIPGQGKPFLDVIEGERRGHTSPRGGIYWEDRAYSDRRVLLHIPRGFDLRRPALMIVYFHGNLARLERDVRDRQQVPRQVDESGLNAVLVVPQFAFDALDSSAGRFWEAGVFARFLEEAGDRLAQLSGAPDARSTFQSSSVVLAAYSGGYQPAAYALDVGGARERLRGVILLDALYAEEDKFAQWIARDRQAAFLVSAYSNSSRDNNAVLKRLLIERGVAVQDVLPSRLTPGSVSFVYAGDVSHNDFVSRAFVNDPLKALLARVPGFSRAADGPR